MGRAFRLNAPSIRRVEREGALPLAALRAISGEGPGKLIECIVRGRLGVHLDAYRCRRTGDWYSSEAAVVRFAAEVAREEEWRAECERERAAELGRRGVVPADLTVMTAG